MVVSRSPLARLVALAAFVTSVACSSTGDTSGDGKESFEKTGQAKQAITDGCTLEQIGAPCRPSTAGGLGKECAGVCAIVGSTTAPGATVACVALATVADNDGKVCGKKAGETSDCQHTCNATGDCVASAAAVGTACRPSAFIGTRAASICDGACNAAGVCVAYAAGARPCPLNKTGDCKYDFCDALSSSTCVSIPLPTGTDCATGSACTTGDKCDSTGTCVGTPVTCGASTNPCQVNVCDTTRGCIGVPVSGTPACTTYFDKCYAGVCGGGTCNKGAAKSCDDGDPCTTDSCASPTGTCLHTAIFGCGADAGVDSGLDTGVIDTGVIDTGVIDTGVIDTGVIDTGVIDTGVIDTGVIDSGADTRDSGTTIDSGIDSGIDTGSGTDSGLDTGSSIDTGSSTDSGVVVDSGGDKDSGGKTDSGASVDSGSADGGETDGGDAGEDPDVVLESACGCRVVGEASDAKGGATAFAVSFLIAGLVVRRRRRSV